MGNAENSIEDVIANFNYELALIRKRMTKIEEMVDAKNNGHRKDFDFMAVQLRDELHRKSKAMTARDVKNFFHFKHDPQAYRLMQLTAKSYPEEVRIQKYKRPVRIIPIEF